MTDCCCAAFCAVTAPHSGSSAASHPQICVGRSKYRGDGCVCNYCRMGGNK